MNTFTELKKIITENNSFLLSTHVNPDADAIGSELAFYYLLKKLGKEARIVNHSATPYNLEFMDDEKIIEKFDTNNHEQIFDQTDVFVLLDLNQASRVVKMESGLRKFDGIKICIDHHQEPEEFFDYIFGGIEYSATGEIIFDFIKESGLIDIDLKIASQIYAAVMTDTGSFRFERTSPKVHLMAAHLLEKGVVPKDIYDKIYDQFKFGRIKLLGEALSTISMDKTGRIAYMVVTINMLTQNNASEADVDGFVNYCLSIQNVEMGILFYELKDGIKISFRSKGDINVSKLAKEFNGGGHINASGARLFNVGVNETISDVLKKAKLFLK